MAASAWFIFNRAKGYLMDGTIDLDTDKFFFTLHTSAADLTANAPNLTSFASVGSEVAEGNGYSSSGKQLSAVTWGVGASAGEYRFDCTAKIWTATGGNIANVRYAVIRVSGGQVLAWAELSTAQFTVTQGNTLTITPSANGIFELN